MPDRKKLDEKDILSRIANLKNWQFLDGKLRKEFRFPDFVKAFGFMTGVALLAESLNHHPNWSNVYNSVMIELYTHDANGITEYDFTLAERIDALVA
ncbi:4a-hydroxytetrahydrobiopterin dehydratase [bacterium]|nr:4a-hydroxytetrahydrobiopterin dehydratase [bacterium]